MTLEQTLETVAKIQKAWDALALSISDAAEAFAKMWEEVFSSLIFGPDGSLSAEKVRHVSAQKASVPGVSGLSLPPHCPSKQALPAAFLLRMRLDISNLR